MQSIIGYSDDDRSDDELKRSKTLSKSKPKDGLGPRKTITVPTTQPSSAALGPIPNEPRTQEDADPSLEPKPTVRAPKSKANPNASMIRRTTAPVVPTAKSSEQAGSSTSTSTLDPKGKAHSQAPVEPQLQDLSIGPGSSREDNELAQIRTLLQPPPIPGAENFGIPAPSEDPVDSELVAKVSKFLALKKQGTHFNDILMRNKSFNNPHIYAKLVDFVEVDETGSNFPKNMWDPHDVQPEWYAEELAAAQKKRSAEVSASQAPGKRSRIAFSASAVSSTSGMHPSALENRDKSSSSRHTSKNNPGRQAEKSGLGRSRHADGGRSDSGGSGGGSHRHHPYQRPPTQDTNMGWMPRNDRSGRRW